MATTLNIFLSIDGPNKH